VFFSTTLRVLGRVMIVMLAALGIYLGYRYFTSEPPPQEFNHYQEYVIDQAAGELVAAVAPARGKPRKLLLPRGRGDATGRVTYVVEQKLKDSGRAEVLEPQITEDAQESVKEWFFSAARKIIKPEEAKALAERSHADAFLFLTVEEFYDSPRASMLSISFQLQDGSGEEISRGQAGGKLVKSAFSLTYLRLWMWSRSPWVAIFLPLATYKIGYSVLAKQRNLYNALLIGAYTAVDAVGAWILLGFTLEGFATFMLFVLALLGGGVWSFLILDEFEDMRR